MQTVGTAVVHRCSVQTVGTAVVQRCSVQTVGTAVVHRCAYVERLGVDRRVCSGRAAM